MAMPSLCAIVCPNGLGHYRRVMAILDKLCELLPNLSVTVVAAGWQRTRTNEWPVQQRVLSRAAFVDGVTDPGVHWSTNPAVYADGRLLAWEKRLADISAFHEADVVVSDNLAGVLSLRPDALLLGTFLWSDVLADAYGGAGAVDEFVIHERALLQAHTPQMCCVGYLLEPGAGVDTRTRGFPVGFMVEERASAVVHHAATRRPRVALLGGATGVVDDVLAREGRRLLQQDRCDVVASAEVAAVLGIEKFEFTAKAYADCDVVVCRPGLGTITACVGAGVPMVALCEEENAEIRWNAQCVEKLGLGHASDNRSVVEVVERCLPKKNKVSARTRELDQDGIARAAHWLFSQFHPSPGPQMSSKPSDKA